VQQPDTAPGQPVDDGSASEASASGQRVSWFELFYDLMIVAAISLVGKVYLKSPTWTTTGQITVAMVVLFTVWLLTTLFFGLHRGDSFARRLLLVAQMIAIALSVLALDDAGLKDASGLGALAIVLIVPALLFWHASTKRSPSSGASRVLAICCVLGAALLGLGAVLTPAEGAASTEWVVQGFAVAAVLVILVPLFVVVLPRIKASLDWHHLDERFGLIVIIVLGESFLNLIATVSAVGSIPRPGYFGLTIVIAYCLWAMYFSSVQAIGAPRSLARLRLWIVGHALLVFSAVAVAVEFTSLTVGDASGVGMVDGNWTALPLAGAVGAVLLLTSTVQGASRRIVAVHSIAFAVLIVLALIDNVQSDVTSNALVTTGAFIVIADAVACGLLNRRPAGS
jgi:low temperature requirement protein LtrA